MMNRIERTAVATPSQIACVRATEEAADLAKGNRGRGTALTISRK